MHRALLLRLGHSLLLAAGLLLGGNAAAAGSEAAARHVIDRLSFGPAPGDIERVMRIGVDAYIDEQLHPERLPLPAHLQQELAALPLLQASPRSLVERLRGAQQAARDDRSESRQALQALHRQMNEEFAAARLRPALESPRQLQEVMVDFWYNHFNVYSAKGIDHALVADYEQKAIRPHVLGRFRDLLGATARHPAMLFYLDNWLSATPGFQPRRGGGAQATASGLNENYARELMELHTLGVDGGYRQEDVTALARIFTGWTIDPRGRSGEQLFVFDPRRHDDGDKTWLGQTVRAAGQAEGERALDRLAAHPATARRIAFKLAQYFVGDQPPPALVERLSQRFRDTDGDIRAVLASLFASPEFRAPAARGGKYKTPYRFVLSALRAADLRPDDVRPLLGALRQQGMPLYGCATPDGYKQTADAWLNPDATSRRVAFATGLAAGRLSGRDDARPDAARLLATLGEGIGQRTRAALADSPPALRPALILGSPDFMMH